MANTIKLDVSQVRGTITNYQQRKQEFDEIVNRIDRSVANLEGTWKGEAQRAFSSRMREMATHLKSIDREIDGAVSKMNSAINVYSDLEARQEKAASALDAGRSDYVS